MSMVRRLLIAMIALTGTARAEPAYPWLAHTVLERLADRFAPPSGARRVAVEDGSFGEWLRRLPLLAPGAPVHLYDGSLKARQDVHAAVIDLDVGTRDLQQCADAVMRLRAEYLYSVGKPIRFHPDPGKPRALAWSGGRDRERFRKYLVALFADAGTASLAAELARGKLPLGPGDVLIQGGYPGHAVLVLDAADAADGRRLVLLGQSYMPAQEFHVLKNLGDPSLSPWFDAAALAGDGLVTPEWRPFHAGDVRRFE
jgi:Domain of unknown function (4846)